MERMIKAAERLGFITEEVIDTLRDDRNGGPHGFIQNRRLLPLLEAMAEYVGAVTEELTREEPEPQADDEPAEESEEPTLT